MKDGDPVLSVEDLSIRFGRTDGGKLAVDGVSLEVSQGEVYGLVGESGSGKSTTALAVLRLLPENALIGPDSKIRVRGKSLLDASDEALRGYRGGEVGMVFQNPMSSLNPSYRIGWQLAEAVRAHACGRRRDVDVLVAASLREVGLPDVGRVARAFPHQLSGGMLQRVGIALSLINRPALLIADEPTTALDVTIQAQVLALLREVTDSRGTGLLLITHDLGVVARMCDRVGVMWRGRIVEEADTAKLFEAPGHIYTRDLIAKRKSIAATNAHAVRGREKQ